MERDHKILGIKYKECWICGMDWRENKMLKQDGHKVCPRCFHKKDNWKARE